MSVAYCDIVAEFGVSRDRVRSVVRRLGLKPVLDPYRPGSTRLEVRFSSSEADAVRAELKRAAASQPECGPRRSEFRRTGIGRFGWATETDLPEFVPVPLGPSGIMVPAHVIPELVRRRAKYAAGVR